MTGEASDPGAESGRRGKKKGGKKSGGEGEPVDTRTPEEIAADKIRADADHAEHIATAQRLAQVELDKRKKEAAARDEKAAEELKNDSILRNLNPVARSDKFPRIKSGGLFNASKNFNDRAEKRAVQLSRPAFAVTGLLAQFGAWVWSFPAVQQLKEILFGKAEK